MRAGADKRSELANSAKARQCGSKIEDFRHQARPKVSRTSRIEDSLSHERAKLFRTKTAFGREQPGTWRWVGRWVVGDRAPAKKSRCRLLPPLTAFWEHDFRPVSQRDRASSIVPVLRRRPEPHQLTFSHLRLSALCPNREFRPSRLVFD